MASFIYTASKLLGRRAPQTRKTVASAVKSFLIDHGWSFLPLAGSLVYHADFIAKKGTTEIAVRCSGSDDRLLGSQVIDMREMCLKCDLHPVYVTGEQVEFQVLDRLHRDGEVLVKIEDLAKIESEISCLRPIVVGAVDWIGLPNVLQGWAKLSPVPGPATILAQMKCEILGSCEALGFPSTSPGHERYGFRLQMSRGLEKREMLGELRIKVLYRGNFIRLLQIWDQAPFVNLS